MPQDGSKIYEVMDVGTHAFLSFVTPSMLSLTDVIWSAVRCCPQNDALLTNEPL